ncbi:hypothetical protein Tco_0764632, partial [Tanacetum coccineum]
VLRRYKIVILRIFLPELYLPSYVSTTERTAELAATTETETEVAVEKAGVMSNIRKQDKDAMESAAEKALAQILEVNPYLSSSQFEIIGISYLANCFTNKLHEIESEEVDS